MHLLGFYSLEELTEIVLKSAKKLGVVIEKEAATEIASRRFTPRGSSEVAPLAVTVTAPEPGTYRLKVEADKQAGELVTTNNQQIAFVDVREGGGRILYLCRTGLKLPD